MSGASGVRPLAIDPSAAPLAVARLLGEAAGAIESELDRRLAIPERDEGDPERLLMEAMRYAALGPGKRLRPALTLAACRAVGGSAEAALAAAAAVELLHTYTLVHDDLPAMDDDDVRRGRPTVHRAYDEATAILAGDGLLTAAFAALADLGSSAGEAAAVLARRSGAAELLAGQAIDLAVAAGRLPVDAATRERLHALKTGALFSAACELGAIAGGAGARDRRALADYGLALGIAFQYADDLDDGDFPEQRELTIRRRTELGRQAVDLARSLGPAGSALAELAAWVGGLP
ncbi:MAG TPA: polyprenyl synthetase family protein [Kofleriaceae bacterium]|nr:polyprenyl synthetase family protein [Kofleriaceae bacterium]